LIKTNNEGEMVLWKQAGKGATTKDSEISSEFNYVCGKKVNYFCYFQIV
jgi:hypothetical protein